MSHDFVFFYIFLTFSYFFDNDQKDSHKAEIQDAIF